MSEPLKTLDSLPNSAFVRISTVAMLFVYSLATIRRGGHDGRIPKPIKDSDCTSVWHMGEIRAARSRAELSSLMAAGEFPRPLQLGSRAIGWLQSDLDAWGNTWVRGGHTQQVAP